MVIKIILIILLALTCLDMLGVKTTSLIPALGAVGLAVSLALQNSLANLAGGVDVYKRQAHGYAGENDL